MTNSVIPLNIKCSVNPEQHKKLLEDIRKILKNTEPISYDQLIFDELSSINIGVIESYLYRPTKPKKFVVQKQTYKSSKFHKNTKPKLQNKLLISIIKGLI